MKRLLGLLAAFGLVTAVRMLMPGQVGGYGAAAMALGFVLVVSFVVGRKLSAWGLPSISGYILVGMAFGPYLGQWVHPLLAVLGQETIGALQLLDAVALGLIALSAGGELRWDALREHALRIGGVLAIQVVLVFAGVTGLVMLFREGFPLLAALEPGPVLGSALLFGVACVANSPATALAIIQEYRSRGPMTDVVLSVTVAKDVVVISLFTLVAALVMLLMQSPGTPAGPAILHALWEIVGSISIGVALGALVVQYLKRVGFEVPLMVLGVAFTAVTVLPSFDLSGLLACMVAGYFIENFSEHGDDLIKAIEQHTLPIYVVFFTIAGAGLNLHALATHWKLALFLAGVRIALTWAATVLGAWATRSPPALIRHGWSGFVAQAGVTLGFAILIGERFPEIGAPVKTVLVAMIAINQVVGPLLFRFGLLLAGEIPEEEGGQS